MDSEKRHMQEELSRSEGRASKLDLQRIALDGDIQRLQMVLQEKDNQIRNYQERIDNQTRSSAQIEDRYYFQLQNHCPFSTNIVHYADAWR